MLLAWHHGSKSNTANEIDLGVRIDQLRFRLACGVDHRYLRKEKSSSVHFPQYGMVSASCGTVFVDF
jgi:hypothetical protein